MLYAPEEVIQITIKITAMDDILPEATPIYLLEFFWGKGQTFATLVLFSEDDTNKAIICE